jgi:general secretion pathway protein E
MSHRADPPAVALADILVRAGHCDARALERAQRMAEETGQRLDSTLLQLGLISERSLAEAYAALLELPIAGAAHYPAELPLLADRLTGRFLRFAGARRWPDLVVASGLDQP